MIRHVALAAAGVLLLVALLRHFILTLVKPPNQGGRNSHNGAVHHVICTIMSLWHKVHIYFSDTLQELF